MADYPQQATAAMDPRLSQVAPIPTSPTDNQLMFLEARSSSLTEQLGMLADQLAPVLGQENPPPMGNDSAAQEWLPSVPDRIRTVAQQLDHLVDAVGQLRSRLHV